MCVRLFITKIEKIDCNRNMKLQIRVWVYVLYHAYPHLHDDKWKRRRLTDKNRRFQNTRQYVYNVLFDSEERNPVNTAEGLE